MKLHLVSDGRQSGRSSPWLPCIFGVDSFGFTPFFWPDFSFRVFPPRQHHVGFTLSCTGSDQQVQTIAPISSDDHDPQHMKLRIIATGGTFDKHYNPLDGQLVFGDSVLPAALRRARLTVSCEFQSLMAMDSLDMLDEHRQQILDACQTATEEHIVIVHGTDTLRETADVLGRAALRKNIVLTGAMVPYDFADSDALFNLGFAVAAAQLAAPGVWVAMNGQVFAWNDVHKNRAAGVFERTD